MLLLRTEPVGLFIVGLLDSSFYEFLASRSQKIFDPQRGYVNGTLLPEYAANKGAVVTESYTSEEALKSRTDKVLERNKDFRRFFFLKF